MLLRRRLLALPLSLSLSPSRFGQLKVSFSGKAVMENGDGHFTTCEESLAESYKCAACSLPMSHLPLLQVRQRWSRAGMDVSRPYPLQLTHHVLAAVRTTSSSLIAALAAARFHSVDVVCGGGSLLQDV